MLLSTISLIHIIFYPNQHWLVQIQQWKHQKNVYNLFKVNNKDTKETSLTSMPADLIKTKTHSTCDCVTETFLVEILLFLVRNLLQYEAVSKIFESNDNFSSNQFQTANYISNNTQ